MQSLTGGMQQLLCACRLWCAQVQPAACACPGCSLHTQLWFEICGTFGSGLLQGVSCCRSANFLAVLLALYRSVVLHRVYKKQSRPVFPSGVPALYSNLARQCWETDVHLRPSFAQIRKELQVGYNSSRGGGTDWLGGMIHSRCGCTVEGSI
jgi:hypothetical protein